MLENIATSKKKLGLPIRYEARVQLCFDIATHLIPGSEIYLYGNYAENKRLQESDVRLLILIGEGFSRREMKTLGWEVQDLVYKVNNQAFAVDVIVLSQHLYEQGLERSEEMRKMVKNKKNLREIRWIDN